MSGNARNVTALDSSSTSVAPYKNWAFDQYLTYCALGGMMVSDQGGISGLTLGEFCARVDIDEKTTWRWKHMSDFPMKVRQRREEIIPLARETAAWNRLFLIGMTSLPTREKEVVNQKTGRVMVIKSGNKHDDQRAAVDALKTYIGHYGDLRLPTVKQEIKVEGGIADLLNIARERRSQTIQEGEVVDASATDA